MSVESDFFAKKRVVFERLVPLIERIETKYFDMASIRSGRL